MHLPRRFASRRPARLQLAHVPTPLEEHARVRVGLWVKRDDCTGIEWSGNKIRKLAYLVADALSSGCDTLVTAGAIQSNHARATAAVAARLGLNCVLVLSGAGDADSWHQGNALIDRIYGVQLVRVADDRELTPALERVSQELSRQGRRPYAIPIGGTCPLAAWGYIDAAEELYGQVQQLELPVHRLVCAAGSLGTLIGLACGTVMLDWDVRVTGISISSTLEKKRRYLERCVVETCDYLGLDRSQVLARIDMYDYAGAGYGKATPEELNFLINVARATGLLLDPVYTAKALFGLLDLCRQEVVAPDENVVFFHTGGFPGLLAFGRELDVWLDPVPPIE